MGVCHVRADRLRPFDPSTSSSVVTLFHHDATQPFGQGAEAFPLPSPDLIVGNPPWGKNIGVGEDAVRIVREVVRAFPRATCGLVVSEWTFNQLQYQQQLLESRSGLVLVEHCHVGPNRLVVLRADIH
jgi:hypothetical protein